MKRIFLMILCLGLLAIPATTLAADFNIKSWCKQVSDSVGGSYVIMEGCIQNELESKARIGD